MNGNSPVNTPGLLNSSILWTAFSHRLAAAAAPLPTPPIATAAAPAAAPTAVAAPLPTPPSSPSSAAAAAPVAPLAAPNGAGAAAQSQPAPAAAAAAASDDDDDDFECDYTPLSLATCRCCGFGMILLVLLLEMIADIGLVVASCCNSPHVSVLVFAGVFFDLVQVKTKNLAVFTVFVILSLLDELALLVIAIVGVVDGISVYWISVCLLPLIIAYRLVWYFSFREEIVTEEISVANLNSFLAVAVASSTAMMVPFVFEAMSLTLDLTAEFDETDQLAFGISAVVIIFLAEFCGTAMELTGTARQDTMDHQVPAICTMCCFCFCLMPWCLALIMVSGSEEGGQLGSLGIVTVIIMTCLFTLVCGGCALLFANTTEEGRDANNLDIMTKTVLCCYKANNYTIKVNEKEL